MWITNVYASDDTISIGTTDVIVQEPETTAQPIWISMIPMLLIFVVFYFLLIRPQEKRRRQKEEMVSTIKKGQEIVTNSGIFGIVVKINDSDNTVDLEVAKDVQIKILRSTIVDIIVQQKEENKKVKKDKGINSAKSS